MLSVTEALNVISQHAVCGPVETVALASALNRCLAIDVLATQDSPPFDKALMDGFAVKARPSITTTAAIDSPVVTLHVAETITAGKIPTQTIHADNASRIMTGAPLPPGCDCVVPIELTLPNETLPDVVQIPVSVMRAEANLMRQGTAATSGSPLLSAGTRLQPQHIAALAEFGFGSVEANRIPRVAVLATGDELIEFNKSIQFGQIRNSNEPMLLTQIQACHAHPVPLGIARDDAEDLFSRIKIGVGSDVLLLSGGVSAGILDLVPQQLARAGVQQIFHGVNMKPGKPLWFGKLATSHHSCLVFGLPGNPVSSLACFELFVRPLLNQLSGQSGPVIQLAAQLSESASVKGNRPTYQPARISVQDSRLTVRPVPWSGSSDLRATVEANGMALLLPEHGLYNAGDQVPVWLWGTGGMS
jgi:molybdopterin molybdotransferase